MLQAAGQALVEFDLVAATGQAPLDAIPELMAALAHLADKSGGRGLVALEEAAKLYRGEA